MRYVLVLVVASVSTLTVAQRLNASEISWVDFALYPAGAPSKSGLTSDELVLTATFTNTINMHAGYPAPYSAEIDDPSWPFANTTVSMLTTISNGSAALATTLTFKFTNPGGLPRGGSIGIVDLEDPDSQIVMSGFQGDSPVSVNWDVRFYQTAGQDSPDAHWDPATNTLSGSIPIEQAPSTYNNFTFLVSDMQLDSVVMAITTVVSDGVGFAVSASDPGVFLDHFMFYKVRRTKKTSPFIKFGPLLLTDEFRPGGGAYNVMTSQQLGLPAKKNDEPLADELTQLKEYKINPARGVPTFEKLTDVQVANQCNDAFLLEVKKPMSILVPTHTSLLESPLPPDEAQHNLDHFLCYKAKAQRTLSDGTKLPKFPKGIQVVVADQFIDQQFPAASRLYDLKKITRLCTPVDKSGNPVLVSGPNKGQPFPITPALKRHPNNHLVCYQAKLATKLIPQTGCGPTTPGDRGTKIEPAQSKHEPVDPVFVNNQFGPEVLETVKEGEFCIPSTKTILPP